MDAVFDSQNRQIPDPTPIELPIGYTPPESMQQLIARMIHVQSEMAGRKGHDTLEDAEDFDMEDEEFAGDSRYTWTELQEEQLKQAFESKSNRIKASDEEDQDDEGDPLPEQQQAPAPPPPPPQPEPSKRAKAAKTKQ